MCVFGGGGGDGNFCFRSQTWWHHWRQQDVDTAGKHSLNQGCRAGAKALLVRLEPEPDLQLRPKMMHTKFFKICSQIKIRTGTFFWSEPVPWHRRRQSHWFLDALESEPEPSKCDGSATLVLTV